MTATSAIETARTPRGRFGPCSDEDLVANVRAGDDAAFESLYERYNRRVAYYVYGMVHDYGRAEDIAQEIFMSALRRMRQTDRPIAFKPWIYEIAKNACIDQFRRSQRTNEVSYEAENALGTSTDLSRMAHCAGTPDLAVEQKMSLDNLCGAFSGLSETHHQILVMRELEGLSYQEIGERLDMSRPAVESTLFRARRRLAEEYDELITGERCVKVQAIVDGAMQGTLGTRDCRRLAAHISHCQTCRRHAYAAGVDVDGVRSPSPSKVAALLPFPLLLRRRPEVGGEVTSAGGTHGSMIAQWSSQLSAAFDPSVAGWARAAAAAATVVVAGVGVGSQEANIAAALIGDHGNAGPRTTHVQPAVSKPGHRTAHHTRITVSRGSGALVLSPGGHAKHHASAPARPVASLSLPVTPVSHATLGGLPQTNTRPVTDKATSLDQTPGAARVRNTVRPAAQALRRQAAAAEERSKQVVNRIVEVLKGT